MSDGAARFTEWAETKLTRLKYGIMSEYHGVKLDAFTQDQEDMWTRAAERFLIKLRALVTAEQIEDTEIAYPADWWQAVKQRFAPRWALRRWPVRMERYSFEAHRLYPRVSWPSEEGGMHARVIHFGGDDD